MDRWLLQRWIGGYCRDYCSDGKVVIAGIIAGMDRWLLHVNLSYVNSPAFNTINNRGFIAFALTASSNATRDENNIRDTAARRCNTSSNNVNFTSIYILYRLR